MDNRETAETKRNTRIFYALLSLFLVISCLYSNLVEPTSIIPQTPTPDPFEIVETSMRPLLIQSESLTADWGGPFEVSQEGTEFLPLYYVNKSWRIYRYSRSSQTDYLRQTVQKYPSGKLAERDFIDLRDSAYAPVLSEFDEMYTGAIWHELGFEPIVENYSFSCRTIIKKALSGEITSRVCTSRMQHNRYSVSTTIGYQSARRYLLPDFATVVKQSEQALLAIEQ